MYKTQLIILSLGLLFACNKPNEKQEELYVELKKNHAYYQEAQNRIDTSLKQTEEDLLSVRDSLQSELGPFSIEYQMFNEDLKKFLTILEEKAISHKDVLYEQAVLEDEILNQRMEYNEALEKKELIEKRREEVEKNFELSLSLQDTLLTKANKLINKNS
ncbi:MAG TPA: hypothetical protein VD908_07165 [Cytophagales bacterium]|nr:hypothetical protein [Cytophagales bacterium]